MPVYEYTCNEGHKFERYLPLKDYKEPQNCECGADSKRRYSAPMINADMQPNDRYISPATGKVITSYKQRKDDMERSGCVDYEPSLRVNSKKVLEAAESKLEKKMDNTVEESIGKMDNRKREKLANELNYGAECAYDRR